MTNAEKIRQMTDEELAYMLIPGDYVPRPNHLVMPRNCQADCTKCVLEWLQEEADDGNSNEKGSR